MCLDSNLPFFAWARSTHPKQVTIFYRFSKIHRKYQQKKLFCYDTHNLVPRLSQLMAHACYFGLIIVLSQLIRLFSWTSSNIVPSSASSGKIWNKRCFSMIRTTFSQDSVDALYCESTTVLPELVRFLSWASAYIWPGLNSSG